MSYIDSYEHEYIGKLGIYPIYHPLAVIGDINGEWGEHNFKATPQNLVIGGGSGELPAIVLHKLESFVAIFLYAQLTPEEEEQLSAEDKKYLNNLCYDDKLLEFCGWSVSDYTRLTKMAESYSDFEDNEEDVEYWIYKTIGELVYYSLPDLNPEHDKLTKIFAPFDIYPTMENVTCSPPGYPTKGGMKIVNGRLSWGLHRW